MDFKDIVYAYFFACRAFICHEKNELLLHRVSFHALPDTVPDRPHRESCLP